jgi:hypothetical protein
MLKLEPALDLYTFLKTHNIGFCNKGSAIASAALAV